MFVFCCFGVFNKPITETQLRRQDQDRVQRENVGSSPARPCSESTAVASSEGRYRGEPLSPAPSEPSGHRCLWLSPPSQHPPLHLLLLGRLLHRGRVWVVSADRLRRHSQAPRRRAIGAGESTSSHLQPRQGRQRVRRQAIQDQRPGQSQGGQYQQDLGHCSGQLLLLLLVECVQGQWGDLSVGIVCV